MADTWGEIIARNYSMGRAIGDDFSSARFSKRAQQLKEEYKARAETEGKSIQDYLPEMEERLAGIAVQVGATRRGVTGKGGKALDVEYGVGLREEVERGGERRAGALAMGGDQAGARTARAGTQYALGNFDQGQSQQIAGDTVRATSGAMRPDGTYDIAAGSQALSGVGAQYGDASGAAAQQQNATTFRLQAATAKADALFKMVPNLDKFSNDQIAGTWAGLQESVPELKGIDVRKGDDNKLYIYSNGQATGSIDPKDPADMDELANMLTQFTSAPGAALQSYQQARLKSIEEQKSRGNEIDKTYRNAEIDVVKKLADLGVPEQVSQSVLNAQRNISSGTNGWQLQDIGEDAGTYLMQKNGQVYTIKTNVVPDPESGEVGGTVQVFDANGQPVSADVLDRQDQTTITQSLVELSAAQAATNYKLKVGAVKDSLNILNQMRSRDLGLPAATGGRSSGGALGGAAPEDVEKIQSDFKEMGSRHGFKITSMERGVMPGVGAGARSQHPKGTAVDYSVKGKTKEEGDALIADLRSAGYEVIDERDGTTGTGPHIHAELPPGGAPQTATIENPARQAADASAAIAAQRPISRTPAGPTSDEVMATRGELMQSRVAYDEAKNRLREFERDYGLGPGQQQLLGPAETEAYRQMKADVDDARMAMLSEADRTRSEAGALARATMDQKRARGAEDVYSRYGGAADFLRRAAQ